MNKIICFLIVLLLIPIFLFAGDHYLACDPPAEEWGVTSCIVTLDGVELDPILAPFETGTDDEGNAFIYLNKVEYLAEELHSSHTATAIFINEWGPSDPSDPYGFTAGKPGKRSLRLVEKSNSP